MLRTSKALSQAVSAGSIVFSLILFTWVYLVLFVLFIYLLNKKIKHGPYDEENLDHSPRHIEMADSLEGRYDGRCLVCLWLVEHITAAAQPCARPLERGI